MSFTEKYRAVLTFHAARFDDDAREMIPGDIEFWEDSLGIISQRKYEHKGREITIDAQWKSLVRDLKKRKKTLEDFKSGKVGFVDLFKTVKVPVNVTVFENTESRSFSHSYPYIFLEHYAYEVFTLTNLSRPGVCDFYGLLISITPNDVKDRHPLKISSYGLECAWEDSLEKEFPKLQAIPLSETADWYKKIGIGIKQKAKTPIEKALFSFQHLCRTGEDISSAVWIFHALEALFSTKVGEGFSNLINRISSVLELSQKQESIVKKKLRKLYDMRNALIHGGFEIYHPLRNEVLDYDVDEQFTEIYENLQFGESVIISCLQKMILKKSYGIKIQESIVFID